MGWGGFARAGIPMWLRVVPSRQLIDTMSHNKTGSHMNQATNTSPVVIDLGEQKAKSVKQLRRGEGSLMADVLAAIAELASTGAISNGVPQVIVVVEAKPKEAVWEQWM